MHRTARRRATHHVARPQDPDPADLCCSAAAAARILLPVLAGCPDALSAERFVSDLAAAWSAADAARVALAIEVEEPDSPANAALHALAWTLRCPEAVTLVNLRADEAQLSPPWAADLGVMEPTGATGIRQGGEQLVFISFDGPQPHVLAAGRFGGRRVRLGLLRPEALPEADAGEHVELAHARDVLATVLGPASQLCADGGPDLRQLARRRLEVLETAS